MEKSVKIQSRIKTELLHYLDVKSRLSQNYYANMVIKSKIKSYVGTRFVIKSALKSENKTPVKIQGIKDFAPVRKILSLYKRIKINEMLHLMNNRYETFEADFSAFTNSSTVIGNVRYDNDTGHMTVIIGGKEYSFCRVPRRVFDGFKGAASAGAYFNRNIKGLYNC